MPVTLFYHAAKLSGWRVTASRNTQHQLNCPQDHLTAALDKRPKKTAV